MNKNISIQMIGIDYSKASLAHRELFSLTRNHTIEAVQSIKNALGNEQETVGCVIISTCNRTEIWTSCEEKIPLLSLFCKFMQVREDDYSALFTARSGEVAARYLFSLTCGLNSQIFGEDQILTQVKTALSTAREVHTAGTVLEVLFRSAITCAKLIKSTVHLTPTNTSVPARAVSLLEQKLGSLEGKKVLVIGNGAMGRLTAKCLVERGATVLMTLRQYKRQDVIIPMGTDIIPYDERYRIVSEMDIIISATLSPHYTLKRENMPLNAREVTIVDLAVPRDIEPSVGEIKGVRLYDMDSLCDNNEVALTTEDSEPLEQAHAIIEEKYTEFEQWYFFRDYIDTVKKISKLTAAETAGKLKKPLKSLPEDVEISLLTKEIERASAKAVSQLLYGLRENLSQEQWKPCMDALMLTAKTKQRGNNI